jgi:hypothetical protein
MDAGQTWVKVGGDWWDVPGAALRGSALTVDEQNADHVVAATAYQVGSKLVGGQIYETHDAGQTWVKVADANGVVQELVIDDGAIYAVADNGMVRYGPASDTVPGISPTDLRSLRSPSISQALILILTLVLAGLVLLGGTRWWSHRNSKLS